MLQVSERHEPVGWRLRFVAAGMLLCACAGSAVAGVRTASVEQFRADVTAMQGLVAACSANAAACDAKAVSADEDVGKPGVDGGFAMHWKWMRDALDTAAKAKPADRATAMKVAETRLEELTQEIGASPGGGDFAKQRGLANSILARPEFHGTTEPSAWDRFMARFWRGVGHLLDGVTALGNAAPWMSTVLGWALFLGAAALLGFFVLRAFSRQRLRVALAEGAAHATAWDRESTDWARLADARAAEGDWREAVHGLYWAAIVHLEAKRSWRHNPSRTPREYVRLLKAGSPQQRALGGLTKIFERVWYGFGEASDAEYGRARSMYDGLASGAADAPAAPDATAAAERESA